MLRFGNNCRPVTQREAGPITPEQREKVLQRIVRQIHGIVFQPTITQLQKNGCVAVSDPYRSLDPILDNTKVLRVEGRLQNSSLAFDEKHAYGTAAYLRTISSTGTIVSRLLCEKSRVAPLAKQTLPRLELCAAVLGAELAERIRGDLLIIVSHVRGKPNCSDS